MTGEQQQTPAALSSGDSRFRAIVDGFGDPILILDQHQVVRYVNAAFLGAFGATLMQVIGRFFEDLLPDAERARVLEALTFDDQGGERLVRLDHHMCRADGGTEIVETAANRMDDPSGRQTIILHLRVVTEQRRLAREQAVRYAVTQILAVSPDLDVALALAARAIATSLEWRAVELWLPDEAGATLRWHEGWHGGGSSDLDDFIAASREFRFRLGDGIPGLAWSAGASQWIADVAAHPAFRRATLAARAGLHTAVAVPLGQGADVAGVMLFFSAATHAPDTLLVATLDDLGRQIGQFVARTRAERALEDERASLTRRVDERTAELRVLNEELGRAVRAKDAFLATMSHELRTPLTTILAVSELLLEQVRGPLTDRQQASLTTIITSGQHLLSLINDILDLSKFEAGRMELQLERVSVAEICQVSMLFVKELAIKKHLQLALLLHNQLATLDADAKRLKQLLVNLLSNAVKFTPEGGAVRLEVSVDAAAGQISFAVHDTGIGIAPEQQARLFQPFVQLDSALHRSQEGTGLGLALVRRLAELHGGSVGVTSALGQGSCFTLTLPLRRAGQESATAPELAQAGERSGPPAITPVTLVIDDSDSMAEQLTHYLQAMGMRVVAHPTAEGALARARQLQPGVIFLDLLLPPQSGWDVLAQLKSDATTRDIPVVIISVSDERAAGLAAGAVAYLVKPVSRADLRDALRTAGLAAGARPRSEPAPETTRARLLLAEDNPTTVEVVVEYLTAQGYAVSVARDGAEALEMAAQIRPDLILLDIQMPEVDGLEVMRRLRATAEHAATPILALTAMAMAGDRERCLAAGATEYMSKPVNLGRLAQEIRRLLSMSR